MTTDSFYVYALLDTRKPGTFKYGRWVFKFKPFYVGKGKGNRSNSHSRHALKNTSSTLKDKKIRNIYKETGELPLVRILRGDLDEDTAFAQERKIVQTIGRLQLKTGPLVNRSDGGEGCKNSVITAVQRLAAAEVRLAYNAKLTPEQRKKHSEAIRQGMARMSPEAQRSYHANISKALRNLTPEQKQVRSSKISKALIEAYQNNPAIKRKTARANSITRQSYAEDQKHHMSIAVSGGHAARSEEAKVASSKLKSKVGKARVANMTEKEKTAHSKRMKAAVQNYWDSADKVERAYRGNAIANGHANMSDSAKARRDKKIAASVALVHASRSAKTVAKIHDKIRQTLLNRDPADKQRQAAGNTMRGAMRRFGIDIHDPKVRPVLQRLIDQTEWDGLPKTQLAFATKIERKLARITS